MRRILILMILCCMHLFAEESLTESFEFQAVKVGNQDVDLDSWDYSLSIENFYGTASPVNGGERIMYNLADLDVSQYEEFFRVTYTTNSFHYPVRFSIKFTDFENSAGNPSADGDINWTNEVPIDGKVVPTLTYIPHGGSWPSGIDSSDFSKSYSAVTYPEEGVQKGHEVQDSTTGVNTMVLELYYNGDDGANHGFSSDEFPTIRFSSDGNNYGAYAVFEMPCTFRFGKTIKESDGEYFNVNGYKDEGKEYKFIPGSYVMTISVIVECGA